MHDHGVVRLHQGQTLILNENGSSSNPHAMLGHTNHHHNIYTLKLILRIL